MNDTLIRSALRANAIFSAVSGLALALGAIPIADLIDAPRWLVALVGVGLLPWAGLLWRFAGRPEIRKPEAWSAVVGDEAWVLATIVLLLMFPTALSPEGNAIAAVIALVVAGFSVAQILGIRAMGSIAEASSLDV